GATSPLGSRVMKDGASHGRPGSSRDLPPVEALRAGLGLRAGYRVVHDRPAAEASAGRAGNRGRPGRRGAVSGASRLRGWDGLRRRPRPLHAGRGLGLRGTRTRLPRSRVLAGTRPRRGRTHSPSMLRALRRGARESDALISAGSWLGWRDCLTTLNVGSAPRVIRTPDLLIRSQTLYPTELWARAAESRTYRHRAGRASDSAPAAFLRSAIHTEQRSRLRRLRPLDHLLRRSTLDDPAAREDD